MQYKNLIISKLEQLENDIRNLDSQYKRATYAHELNIIYEKIKDQISDIKTLIERQPEE